LTEYQWQALLIISAIAFFIFVTAMFGIRTNRLRFGFFGMLSGIILAFVGISISCLFSSSDCLDIIFFKKISFTFGFIRTYQGGMGLFLGSFVFFMFTVIRKK